MNADAVPRNKVLRVRLETFIFVGDSAGLAAKSFQLLESNDKYFRCETVFAYNKTQSLPRAPQYLFQARSTVCVLFHLSLLAVALADRLSFFVFSAIYNLFSSTFVRCTSTSACILLYDTFGVQRSLCISILHRLSLASRSL